MLSSSKIDFYIDNQNQAIPATIAPYYLNGGFLFEELPAAKNVSQLYDQPQEYMPYNRAGIAAALAGVAALGGLWLMNRPALTSLATSDAHPAKTSYFSAIRTQGVTMSATSQMAAPESIARPIFSNQASTNRTSAQVATQDLLQQAQSIGSKALAFSKNAQSIDDWRLVASQWQKAVTMLAFIPSEHSTYALAQQKLAEYRPNLKQALQKAKQPIVEAPLPITTVYRPEPKDTQQQVQPTTEAAMPTTMSRSGLQETQQQVAQPTVETSVPTTMMSRSEVQETQQQTNHLIIEDSVLMK